MKTFDPREKRLVLITDPACFSLSALSDLFLEQALSRAQLRVVDRLAEGDVRSFILSESSLFVTPTCLTAVTCGPADPSSLLADFLRTIPQESVQGVQIESRFTSSAHTLPVVQNALRRTSDSIPGTLHFHSAYSSFVDPPRSTRILMRGPILERRLKDTAAAVFRFFCSLTGPCRLHEYYFSPAGYSSNVFSPLILGCTHITPGNDGYLSIEYCSKSDSHIQVDWDCVLRQFQDLTVRLIAEYRGKIIESRFIHPSGLMPAATNP